MAIYFDIKTGGIQNEFSVIMAFFNNSCLMKCLETRKLVIFIFL